MEKISSIVPQSKRVNSVDLNSAQPVRPGAPSFGRPVGASTVGAGSSLTTAERAIAEHQRMIDQRNKLDEMPQKIQELANRFFLQKTTSAPSMPIEDMDLRPPVSYLPRTVTVDPSIEEAAEARAAEAAELAADGGIDVAADDGYEVAAEVSDLADSAEEEDYVPKGSYIDLAV